MSACQSLTGIGRTIIPPSSHSCRHAMISMQPNAAPQGLRYNLSGLSVESIIMVLTG